MVDLRTKIQNNIHAGLAKLGTVRVTCTYRRMADPTYVPVTGVATNPITSSTSIDVIFSDFPSSRINSTDILQDEEPVRSIDKIAIISGLQLAFVPAIGDDIVVTSPTKTWNVKGVTGDASDAHYELHVRPTSE